MDPATDTMVVRTVVRSPDGLDRAVEHRMVDGVDTMFMWSACYRSATVHRMMNDGSRMRTHVEYVQLPAWAALRG